MKTLTAIMSVGFMLISCVKTSGVDVDIEPGETKEYTAGNLVATDALGRKLPDYSEAGRPRNNKYVAMFYWTWHTSLSQGNPVKDVSKILAEHPEAAGNYNDPAWPTGPGYFYWGEPLFDYYVDTDQWVLRKHAEMLAEADVDVIVFDCTNGSFTWEESYMPLCEAFSQAKKDGVNVPKIAFHLGFGVSDDTRKALNDIYTNLYAPGKYSDLWFYWDGKPLVMHYREAADPQHWTQPADPTAIQNFFTFRPGWPTYNNAPERTDQWGWLQIAPQHGFGSKGGGRYEQTTVGVGQNWSKDRGLTAMNAPGAFGRSYTASRGHITDEGATDHGYNFQEQWDRALDMNPDLVFVTGWNEWIAGRQAHWGGQDNAFPDCYNQEYSRDIEPMKGGHSDNYYYQLISNVRNYKGIAEPVNAPRSDEISINGDFTQWDKYPAFKSYAGNTIHRNHPGWQNEHYTNATGRNDIVESKVAYNDKNLFFFVETASALTSRDDKNWMMLFINFDRDNTTGWEGYDYVINRASPGDKAVLERHAGNGWQWEKVADIDYAVTYNKLELSIPRSALGITGKVGAEFKWADNIQKEGDIMDFYLSGDTAPLGRFNYLFLE